MGDCGCFSAAAGPDNQQQRRLGHGWIGNVFLADVSPVNLFKQVLKLPGYMYVCKFPVKQRKKKVVIFGRELFFQYLVPCFLGISLTGDFKAFLPVG